MKPERETLRPETMTESALIGAAVTFSGCVEDIPGQLDASDFSVHELGLAWAAIRARHLRGQTTDLASVIGDLPPEAADALEAAAGAAATSAYVRQHAELVIRRAAARRLLSGLQLLGGEDLDSLTADAAALIATARDRGGLVSGDDAFIDTDRRMVEVAKVAAEAREGKRQGWRIGIGAIDRSTGGIRPGTTWIVGARPATGKTVMLVQMAHAVAAAGAWTAYISVEMPVIEIAKREAAMASGINSIEISDGRMNDGAWTALTRGIGTLAYKHQGRLVMADSLGSDAEAILAALRRRRRQGKLDVVLVDYIQRLSARRLVARNANRNTELELVSRMFADFDRETGVATVLASQFSRGSGEPTLERLRDSGSLEQDADVVLLMHREDDESEERKFILAKNRQGRTACTWCLLDTDRLMFGEITKREES